MGVMFIGIAVVIKELVGKAQVKQHLLIKDLLPSAEVLIPLPPQLTSELELPLQFTFVTAGTGAPVDTGEELNRSDNAEYLSPPVRLGTDTGC
jgi:hypothetical protein